MGNPIKGSPAYFKKLEKTQRVRQAVALQKLAKSPRVCSLVRAVRRKDAAKWAEQRQVLEEKLQANTLKSNKYYRELGSLNRELGSLRATKKKFEEQGQELEKLRAKHHKTTQELARWTLLWGWVKAHAHKGTLAWLERLRSSGPPSSKDRRRGGGQ